MSYQDYASLGKNTRRNRDSTSRPPRSQPQPASRQRDTVDRPFQIPATSFSAPRRTPPHSSQSSQSSVTLSPSNSASQKGDASPTSDKSNGFTRGDLEQLKRLDLGADKKPNLLDVPLHWRPYYLQRKILGVFILTFVSLIITLEVLWSYSTQSGLGTATTAARYLWALGPAAVFTLIAAVWNRVDYQAKSAAPWIRLSLAPADAERTLLLDYLSMSHVRALVQGLKNGDKVVASTSAVALLLKLMIVVSTALVTLISLDMGEQTVPITLQTEFAGNASSLLNASSTALFTMVGIQQDNLSYPAGVFNGYAYQQFSTDPTLGDDIAATVDGLAAGLSCEAENMTLAGIQLRRPVQQFNTSFAAANCSVAMPISSKGFANDTNSYFARFGRGGCGGSTKMEDQRIVIVVGKQAINMLSFPTNASIDNVPLNGTITQSTQFLCTPVYNISQVDIAMHGPAVLSIAPQEPSSPRMLSAVLPWDLAQAFFESYNNDLASTFSDVTPPFYSRERVNVDPAMYLALAMQLADNPDAATPTALLDPSTLQGLATRYFGQYSSLLASAALTQKTATESTGIAIIQSEKLMMGTLGAQLLTVMLVMSACLTGLAMLFVPRQGFLPRDPGAIVDTAAMIAHSRPLLQALRGVGGGSMATVRDRLRGSSYYTGVEAYEHQSSLGPGYFKIFGGQGATEVRPDYIESTDRFPYPDLLHPVQRTFVIFLVAALIVILELSLQISMRSNGLGNAGDPSYLHILWTSGPALVMILLAMYFSATDMTLRTLAPYAALRKEAPFQESMSINLADKSSPLALLEAMKMGNLAVIGSTTALFFASLLAVVVSTLFTTTIVPSVTNVQLFSRDMFGPVTGAQPLRQNGTLVASLILDSNYSYPPFTYEDMNFPSLELRTNGNEMAMSDEYDLFTLTLPAIRPAMACKLFQKSDIQANITGGATGTVQVKLPIASSGTLSFSLPTNASGNINSNAMFGSARYAPMIQGNGSSPHWLYTWGQLSGAGSNNPSIKTIFALSCNETVEEVSVAMSFLGATMSVDPQHPPLPNESTATPMALALGDMDYSGLLNISSVPNILDGFFSTLVNSQMAIPASDLSSEDAKVAQSVVDAITQQHRIIRTQVINISNRQPIEAVSIGKPLSNAILGKPSTFTAVLTSSSTDAGAARRVVQDMVATRILQGFLGAIIIATIVSWIGLPRSNILPRNPNSIGSLAAFLADGNVFGLLGRGAEWQSTEDLREFFMDGMHVTMQFKVGWDRLRRRRREETLAVWGMNGSCPKDQVFAISAVRTGGWGGGEGVGLGLQARVGYAHRSHVRDWGWRT